MPDFKEAFDVKEEDGMAGRPIPPSL